MKEYLNLRNLKNCYLQKNRGLRKQVFYDSIKNNMILLLPADKDVSPIDIVNGIRDSAYNYIIKELNENKGLTVIWSAVSGTTSDYTIYYDSCTKELSEKTYKEILKYLARLSDDCGNTMKYNEVFNGITTPISANKMEVC